jgi:hypothetical protein
MNTKSHLIAKNLQIKIPKRFHHQPILSRLVSEYHLTFSITGAVLGSNAAGDGWFNLELQGYESDLQAAKLYLRSLDIEIWYEQELDRQ